MNQEIVLKHEFVEFIPEELKERTIYISIRFATVSHLCVCGCGKKVVTPLRPTDWKLIYDGKTISLDPSIGNWSFACQSHYYIRNDRVRWAPRWSKAQIERGRAHDRLAKERYYAADERPQPTVEESDETSPTKARRGFLQWLKWW